MDPQLLTEQERLFLLEGWWLDGEKPNFGSGVSGVGSKERGQNRKWVCKVWERHGGRLLLEHIARRPGTRPWAWWEFDAPEPRRQIEMPLWPLKIEPIRERPASLPSEEIGPWAPGDYHFGMPRLTRGIFYEEQFESERVYLERLGLNVPEDGNIRELSCPLLGMLPAACQPLRERGKEAEWQRGKRETEKDEERRTKDEKKEETVKGEGTSRRLSVDYFNSALADKAERFIQSLKQYQGEWAGLPICLMFWQKGIIRKLFGTVRADGLRRYRKCYVEIPRKNGKTLLAAAISLLLYFADGEPGAEIYNAAAARDQAMHVFRPAVRMIEQSPMLDARVAIYRAEKRLHHRIVQSSYQVLSADANTKHGQNAHGVFFDELHTQKTRRLFDVLDTSMGARRQPLMYMMTTSGTDPLSICGIMHEYADRVINGSIEDPSFLAIIYSAPKEADWKDETVWRRCNPALGVFRKIDEMREKCQKAQNLPAEENSFRQLYLCQWVQQAVRFIKLDLWDENNHGRVSEEELAGRRGYAGLDLSAVSDLTAFGMVFPRDDDSDILDILLRAWCPEARVYDPENRYADQYQVWVRHGFLRVTPGNAVDYAFIRKQVIEDAGHFNLVEIAYDRLFQGAQLAGELYEEGLPMVEMGMGFLSFAAPMVEFERRLLEKKMNHMGHPVLRWNVDNVVVKKDPAGNLKPDKANSQGKIDGFVVVVMALSAMLRNEAVAMDGPLVSRLF